MDTIYMDVDADDQGSLNVPTGSGFTVGTDLNVGIEALILQPMAGYSVYESQKSQLYLLAGARYLSLDVNFKAKINRPLRPIELKISESENNWDGVLGARGMVKLSDKWSATAYLDAGTGDSDYTWQALAGFDYRFEKVSAAFGYRYLKWDFDDYKLVSDITHQRPLCWSQIRLLNNLILKR